MGDPYGVAIISDSPSPPAPAPSPNLPPSEPDFDDAEVDQLFRLHAEENPPMPPVLLPEPGPGAQQDEHLSECEQTARSCFPDICSEYLRSQAAQHEWDTQRLITHILDNLDMGQPYPKQQNPLKRKRQQEDDKEQKREDEEMHNKFEEGNHRLAGKGRDYIRAYTKTAKALLKHEFPQRYAKDIENTLKKNDNLLYTTYLELDKAGRSQDLGRVKAEKNAWSRGIPEVFSAVNRAEADADALAAFDAARAACRAEADLRSAKEAERERGEDEAQEMSRGAEADRPMAECGCCYGDTALEEMVHCNADVAHWFCRDCAKQMAEHVIGASKYHLGCISLDGCSATFSRDQRELFLDDKTTKALELIEQEAVLRMAAIENLVSCPFCSYAAEYPPVEEEREFRCEMPDCGTVSCRLCREETHIPKTCEEAARERGISARRTIEEAMSAAMIRKCNKCKTPFIKENGCNKMTCTRSGCRNVQCYVCSKSCDYSHFDDTTRGGKKGNCPLFDSVEDRHQNEVHAAEEEARKKVAEGIPGVDAEMLKINFSENVKKDDERRKAADYPQRPPMPPRLQVPPPVPIVGAQGVGMPGGNDRGRYRRDYLQVMAPRLLIPVQPGQHVYVHQGQHAPQPAAPPAVQLVNGAHAAPPVVLPPQHQQHAAEQRQAAKNYLAMRNLRPQEMGHHGRQHPVWHPQPHQAPIPPPPPALLGLAGPMDNPGRGGNGQAQAVFQLLRRAQQYQHAARAMFAEEEVNSPAPVAAEVAADVAAGVNPAFPPPNPNPWFVQHGIMNANAPNQHQHQHQHGGQWPKGPHQPGVQLPNAPYQPGVQLSNNAPAGEGRGHPD